MSLTGFKDGKVLVRLNDVECIRIEHSSRRDEWQIVVYLRYNEGDRANYTIYSSKNESEVKEHFDSLVNEYSYVRI